jgi:hypothetical protein
METLQGLGLGWMWVDVFFSSLPFLFSVVASQVAPFKTFRAPISIEEELQNSENRMDMTFSILVNDAATSTTHFPTVLIIR